MNSATLSGLSGCLETLNPSQADQHLPALIAALCGEAGPARQAARLLANHPLLALRRGQWSVPVGIKPAHHTYFPPEQVDAIRRAFIDLSRVLDGQEQRLRMIDILAELDGLSELVNLSELNLSAPERDRRDQLVMCRDLRRFKRQATIVLGYGCNKRCSYCFIDALGQQIPKPISMGNFIRAVDWACRSGAVRIPVTGGEPTLHPNFVQMMAELRTRRVTTCFSTNGCGPSSSFECLDRDLAESITFHILDDGEYTSEDRERLERNIQCVSDKGIPMTFRYVLVTAETPPWRTFFDLAARYHPAFLSCSPAFPGPLREDVSRSIRAMFECKANLLAYLRMASDLGIRPIIAKPVPLCMFSRDELLDVCARATVTNVCDISENCHANNTLINPDLTLYPCMALPLGEATLDDTPGLDAFGARARSAVAPLQEAPMLPECRDCGLYHLKLCQAACLSFVSSASPPRHQP